MISSFVMQSCNVRPLQFINYGLVQAGFGSKGRVTNNFATVTVNRTVHVVHSC